MIDRIVSCARIMRRPAWVARLLWQDSRIREAERADLDSPVNKDKCIAITTRKCLMSET